MYKNKQPPPLLPDFNPERSYRQSELGQLADEILRQDVRSELCRECGERGDKTGHTETLTQTPTDTEGNVLVIDFPEYECANGHHWYQGEGALRGIGGENPILFEEHFQSRKRREIYNNVGSPDPSIVSGIYYRTHPQGRKVNSAEARARHGASYFR